MGESKEVDTQSLIISNKVQNPLIKCKILTRTGEDHDFASYNKCNVYLRPENFERHSVYASRFPAH